MLRVALRFTAAAVAFVAVMIGCVRTLRPELFFRIPKVGFILWSRSTGYPMPPMFDTVQWRQENFGKWAQDGDVIVGSMMKAGITKECIEINNVSGSGNVQNLR